MKTQKQTRTESNLRQIEALQAEKSRIAATWTTRGYAKTAEMTDAISEQVVALYEEIDALEAGETRGSRTEARVGKKDEIAVTPAELAAVAYLGWGREDVVKMKSRRRAR